MTKRMDLTTLFNTPLSPQEEQAFQQWAKQNRRENDTFDYDLRGAWKADAQAASNGHLPDTWKKPNHPTFSNESMYNGVEGHNGGRWVQNGDKWQFYASPWNVQNLSSQGLQGYFQQYEPDSQLVMPAGGGR